MPEARFITSKKTDTYCINNFYNYNFNNQLCDSLLHGNSNTGEQRIELRK